MNTNPAGFPTVVASLTKPFRHPLSDFVSDGQGCRRRRAGRIQHVQRLGPLDEAKILNQGAISGNRLRPDTGATGLQIVHPNLGNKLLQGFTEKPFTK